MRSKWRRRRKREAGEKMKGRKETLEGRGERGVEYV